MAEKKSGPVSGPVIGIIVVIAVIVIGLIGKAALKPRPSSTAATAPTAAQQKQMLDQQKQLAPK